MVNRTEIEQQAWKKAFDGEASGIGRGRSSALKGKVLGMWDRGGAWNKANAVTTGVKDGIKYPFQKAADVTGTSAKWVKSTKPFKLGGYAALAGIGIGALALLSNMGKKKVSADDVTPDLGDTVAMANFDAPTPQITASDRPTLMGEELKEGEHVNRLGKGGQQQLSFQNVAPPRAALEAGFDDVSTAPVR